MQPSQASIPCLVNILGAASRQLQGKEKSEQSRILVDTAKEIRQLASKLRACPETVAVEGMSQQPLYTKALEFISKVTVAHNSTRESGASERDIEIAVASALELCADTLESDAQRLLVPSAT